MRRVLGLLFESALHPVLTRRSLGESVATPFNASLFTHAPFILGPPDQHGCVGNIFYPMENPFPAEHSTPAENLKPEDAEHINDAPAHTHEGASESVHEPKSAPGHDAEQSTSLPNSTRQNERSAQDDHSSQTVTPTVEGESTPPTAEESNPSHGQDREKEGGHPSSSQNETSDEEPKTIEPSCEPGSLEDFTNRARRARLNPEEEAETVRLLKESLLGGRTEVARAIAVTGSLPWVVSVQATTLAWPEMKPSFRAQFLAGLARTQGESAARVRLSLARGLYKVDTTAAKKLILLTLKVLRNKETGFLEGKGAPIFANVLIGRGKAWVLQLPLEDMKSAEADLLVFSALHSAFHAPQAPITQLGILRWAGERLAKLPAALEQLVLKNISRWSGKWQAALRKEVSQLPETWEEVLKVSVQKNSPPANRDVATEHPADVEKSEEDVGQSNAEREETEARDHGQDRDNLDDRDEEETDEDDDEDSQEDSEKPSRHKARPVYVSKTVPNQGAQTTHHQQNRRGVPVPHFNLTDTLRQIESHVVGLRNELHTAQKQLRQREEDPRRSRRAEKPLPQPNPGEFSNDELNRLNQQLELRNAELKTRIDELTLDSEERATSRGLITDTEPPDPNTQLQTLLGWKLKDDYEDFLALQQEARDLVVQQHYKTLLGHVFEVLQAEGIQFQLPKA